MKTYQVTSGYTDTDKWRTDIATHFPKGVKCPVCLAGVFEVNFIDARVDGECNNCHTSVPHYFYDNRYEYLDILASAQAESG